MKRSTKSILLLLASFLLCINSSAQVLESVVVNDLVGVSNRALCDQVGGTDYSLDISFTGIFEDTNTFTIELSDENGSFSDPSKVKTLRTLISTAANDYNKGQGMDNISFQLQEGTYGKNYVIRVTTSQEPVQTVQTDSFEAYYDMFVEGELSINNGNSFTLCNGE
ncbi:hypothetical protein CSC82_32625, partial [Rhodobacteraceae bacterium 4F10]